jgi:2-amino-4-hydroxy-6-hydroxymethyldihydropteridine diphosphokinase
MDRILITDLLARCVLGVTDEERREKQDVVINLVLFVDLKPAARSDRIEDAVNYRTLKKRILQVVESSSYRLVESLAERIAALSLEEPRVAEVLVRVDKPSVLRFARTVGVEILRGRNRSDERVFVGVGSNIEPEENVRRALGLLARQVRVRAVSTFYRTPAIGERDGPPFFNGVVEVSTSLPPRALKLDVLRRIEAQLGRRRGPDPNAPRPIDLDLVLYGDRVEPVEKDGLVLPDPDIVRRPFLALALFELAPGLVLPDSRRALRDVMAGLVDARMAPLGSFSESLRREIWGHG